MNTSIRRTLIVAMGVAALGATATAAAAGAASVLERARDNLDDRRQSEPAPQAAPPRHDPAPVQSRPAPAAAPAPAPAQVPMQVPRERNAPPPEPRAPAVEYSNRGSSSGRSSGSSERRVLEQLQSRAAPPRQESNTSQARPAPAPAPVPRERNASSPAPGAPVVVSGRGNNAGRDERAVLDELLARSQRGGNGNGGGSGGGNGNGNGNGHGDHDDHDGRPPGGGYHPPRIVPSLPRGYRNYYWNDQPYYTFGGVWYQPYGSSYVSIGVPYGLFVSSLPGYSSSFYYGNTRYYYYDDTYYVYEPARRGYVVSRSPYGEDEADDYYYDADARDLDMFIYPARGQSEQQQSDDRYECHRWAVEQTNYNPLDDAYDRAKRADYVRAMTACLTGRGYSVR
jgi:hypothetical protein